MVIGCITYLQYLLSKSIQVCCAPVEDVEAPGAGAGLAPGLHAGQGPVLEAGRGQVPGPRREQRGARGLRGHQRHLPHLSVLLSIGGHQ